MYIKENSPMKNNNMNYQEQKYYQQGKIDGIREFVRELKNILVLMTLKNGWILMLLM